MHRTSRRSGGASLTALFAASVLTFSFAAHAETSFVTIDSDVSGVGIEREPYTPDESPCYAPCMRPMNRDGEYVVKGVMQDRVLTLSEGATHIVFRRGNAYGMLVGGFFTVVGLPTAMILAPIAGIQMLRNETPGELHAAHIMLAVAAISAVVAGVGVGISTLSEPTLRIESGPAPKRPERPAIPRAATSPVRVQFAGTGVVGTF
jgi:hypothetical protein